MNFGTRMWDAAMGHLKYGSGFGIGVGGRDWKNFEKHDLKKKKCQHCLEQAVCRKMDID